jgi:hypothetical protein
VRRADRIIQRLDSAGMGGGWSTHPPTLPALQYTYSPDTRRRWVMALGAGMGERVWSTKELEAALDLLEAYRNNVR